LGLSKLGHLLESMNFGPGQFKSVTPLKAAFPYSLWAVTRISRELNGTVVKS